MIRDLVIVQTTDKPETCIIWLHGLGADGYDFVPVVRELESMGVRDVKYIFPHAPQIPVSINGGYVMRAWYDIKHVDLVRQEDETGIRESGKYIEQLIDEQVQLGFAPSKIILAGFSQGGAITYYQGLRSKHVLGGLITLSTYLPLVELTDKERNPANTGLRILACHGELDEIVPLQRGELAIIKLQELGYNIQLFTYPMEHSVCAEELAEIATFIKSVQK